MRSQPRRSVREHARRSRSYSDVRDRTKRSQSRRPRTPKRSRSRSKRRDIYTSVAEPREYNDRNNTKHDATRDQGMSSRLNEWEPEVPLNSAGYPIRKDANICTFFMKTRWCKFGKKCFRTHPEEALHTYYDGERKDLKRKYYEAPPEVTFNTAGYPMRPGVLFCSFYQHHGWCDFGRECHKDHPEETLKFRRSAKQADGSQSTATEQIPQHDPVKPAPAWNNNTLASQNSKNR